MPAALTGYIEGRQGYDYNEHGRAGNTHAVRARRRRRPVLPARSGPGTWPASRSCSALGVDQFAVYLQHDAKEATLAAYGDHVIPAVADHVTAKS